jgi:hypothetical protein
LSGNRHKSLYCVGGYIEYCKLVLCLTHTIFYPQAFAYEQNLSLTVDYVQWFARP